MSCLLSSLQPASLPSSVPRPSPPWALRPPTLSLAVASSPFPASVQDPGLHIWRVEKLKPVPVARENQGVFFSGDSYLVLHNGPEEVSHLHLWIGKQVEGWGEREGLEPPWVSRDWPCHFHLSQASSHLGTSRVPVPCWLCISTPSLGSGPCSTVRCRAMSPTSS